MTKITIKTFDPQTGELLHEETFTPTLKGFFSKPIPLHASICGCRGELPLRNCPHCGTSCDCGA
jgi:hypothetical protein